MVPLFLIVKKFNWPNTYQGLIVPFLVEGFGVFLMRQYLLGIPNELIEAARMDGASELRIFAQIVMPLCKPALAALGVFTSREAWDMYLRLSALREVRQKSPEVLLSLARVGLDVQDPGVVNEATATLLREDPWEWRAVWLQGLLSLAQRDAAAAQSAFNAVYGQVPASWPPSSRSPSPVRSAASPRSPRRCMPHARAPTRTTPPRGRSA